MGALAPAILKNRLLAPAIFGHFSTAERIACAKKIFDYQNNPLFIWYFRFCGHAFREPGVCGNTGQKASANSKAQNQYTFTTTGRRSDHRKWTTGIPT